MINVLLHFVKSTRYSQTSCKRKLLKSSHLEQSIQEKKIKTLADRSLKNVLLDACTRTAFSFNRKLYEQIDDEVSMSSPLVSLIPNVKITEIESVFVKDLFSKGYFKFYIRCMDDTLVLIKKSDVPNFLQALNCFHKNLNFTVDTFEERKVHFLDLLIDRNTTDIFYKDIYTGQYINFNSFVPWKLKVFWVKSLYSRASKISISRRLLKSQIEMMEQFMSWNGFAKYIRKYLLKITFLQ